MATGTLQQARENWRRMKLHRDWTLHEAMQHALGERPNATVVFHSPDRGVETFTLADVHALAAKLATGFHRLGFEAGDVVAIQLPNGLDNALAHIAATRLGCTVLPIIHIFGPKELNYVLGNSAAKAFIISTAWKKCDAETRLRALDVPSLEHLITIGPPLADIDTVSFDGLLSEDGELPAAHSSDADDVALILYTSGTTAAPKAVLHTHNSLLAEFFELQLEAGGEAPVMLSPWPSGHIAGTLGLLRHPLLGCEAVVMEQWDPEAAATLIEAYAVGQTSGTPLHLQGVLDASKKLGTDVSSLKRFITGATTVPETVIARAEAAGIRACRCYGSTEIPTSTQCKPDDSLEKRLKTDGRPLPGCEIRIVTEDLQDVPIGVEGEILVRGAELARGYGDPALTAVAFLPEGWFRTGDIGRLDAEGYMTVTDRKKDIIIRGGENISSMEIEDLILRMEAVREVAVVASPHERLGEIVCAFVVPAEGAVITIPDIDAHFRSVGVARQKTPERLEVVESLPRNPTGKVLKTELRGRIWKR